MAPKRPVEDKDITKLRDLLYLDLGLEAQVSGRGLSFRVCRMPSDRG